MYRYLVGFVLFFYYVCSYINTMVLIDNVFCFIWLMKYFTFKESRTITLRFDVFSTQKNISIEREELEGRLLRMRATWHAPFNSLISSCVTRESKSNPISHVWNVAQSHMLPLSHASTPPHSDIFNFNLILYNDQLIYTSGLYKLSPWCLWQNQAGLTHMLSAQIRGTCSSSFYHLLRYAICFLLNFGNS